MFHYRGTGLEDVYLVNGYTRHTLSSGEEAVSIHNLEGLHRAIAGELANAVGRMDGDAFRFLRKFADMGQRGIAEVLQVSENTVSNWERGETDVHGAAAELLRALVREIISGNAALANAVDKYNHLDRQRTRHDLHFTEDQGDWRLAA